MSRGLIFLLILLVFITACTEREGLAPVVESNWREYDSKKSKHVVAGGETLYAIAFRYDKDYRTLAQINHLQPPYTVRVGQVISLKSGVKAPVQRRQQRFHHETRPAPPPPKRSELVIRGFDGGWIWPAKGKLVSTYAPGQGKKGINIAGHKGEKIHAASGGIVAYSGNGLSGYGNLIIIKHNNQYLTAYGNNARNFVQEGQQVKKGQVIAQMGMVDRKYWGLHFEIRKAGQPVNPLNYLKKG